MPGQTDTPWASSEISFATHRPDAPRPLLRARDQASWHEPFEVVAAQDHLRPSSPWRDQVAQVLLDRQFRRPPLMLATTEAAGVVAVHFALANEDRAVISVAADPEVDRRLALEAAYEIARLCREDGLNSAGCSLFDLPVAAAIPGRSRSVRCSPGRLVSAPSRSIVPCSPVARGEQAQIAGFGSVRDQTRGVRPVRTYRTRSTWRRSRSDPSRGRLLHAYRFRSSGDLNGNVDGLDGDEPAGEGPPAYGATRFRSSLRSGCLGGR